MGGPSSLLMTITNHHHCYVRGTNSDVNLCQYCVGFTVPNINFLPDCCYTYPMRNHNTITLSPASFYFSQDSVSSCFIRFQPGFHFLHPTSARAAPWPPFPLQLCILLRLRGSVPSSASCGSSPHASSASSPCFIMLTAPLLYMGPVWFSLPQLRLIISVFFLFSFTLSLHLLITPSHHLHYNTFDVSLGPINRLLLLCSWCSSFVPPRYMYSCLSLFFIHIRFFSVSHFRWPTGTTLLPFHLRLLPSLFTTLGSSQQHPLHHCWEEAFFSSLENSNEMGGAGTGLVREQEESLRYNKKPKRKEQKVRK